jgi:hypothetical protein
MDLPVIEVEEIEAESPKNCQWRERLEKTVFAPATEKSFCSSVVVEEKPNAIGYFNAR